MVDVPPEIWLNIARFLSKEKLIRCMSVNALFFNLAMDVLYKEIGLDMLGIAECNRALSRLSDPFIAGRVQRLNLFIVGKEYDTLIQAKQPNSWMRLRQYLKRIVQPSKLLRSRKPSQAVGIIKRLNFKEVMSSFIKCTSNLSNVRDFGICALFTPHSNDFRPLFTSIRTTFGAQLYILSLSGPTELYHGLLEAGSLFPQLKELRLTVYASIHEVPDPPGPLTGDHVALFVNRLRLHLEVLRVQSYTADVSHVFAQLSPLPSLVRLDIDMVFKNLQDTLGLQQFLLHASSTLQKLDVRGDPLNTTFDTYWNNWFSDCQADPKFFSQLRSAKIRPTILGIDVTVLSDFIRHVSRTLEEFSFEERPLSTFDANLVIGALSQCTKLTGLKLNLLTLTITEFDQLADALPNLQSLGLQVGNKLDHMQELEPNSVFLEGLKDRSYADWKLKDLSIWLVCCNGRGIKHNIMIAFSQSIPSLRSFFNVGHMDPSGCWY